MKCIKCFSEMFGPDYNFDMQEKYLSINSDKYISLNYREFNSKKVEVEKISFIRESPSYNMNIKLSMLCIECGYTCHSGINIKVKSQLNIEKHFKKFLKSKI